MPSTQSKPRTKVNLRKKKQNIDANVSSSIRLLEHSLRAWHSPSRHIQTCTPRWHPGQSEVHANGGKGGCITANCRNLVAVVHDMGRRLDYMLFSIVNHVNNQRMQVYMNPNLVTQPCAGSGTDSYVWDLPLALWCKGRGAVFILAFSQNQWSSAKQSSC